LPGSDVTLEDVGLNPTRIGFLSVLRRAGARIDVADGQAVGDEPIGALRIRHGGVAAVEIKPAEVPGTIDELPLLAALATHGGALKVTGASELRHKESDRITALASGLRALGGHIEELDDGFEVDGDRPLRGGTADAAGDHRLAMAFAIAALGAGGPSEIRHADVVDVSYPGFFDILTRISEL
jgi:3-phosphoshikimate 1-carboxyvinyltransferase